MPSFLRSRVMFTSMVRSNTTTSSLHTRFIICSRESIVPRFDSSSTRMSNSLRVSCTS